MLNKNVLKLTIKIITFTIFYIRVYQTFAVAWTKKIVLHPLKPAGVWGSAVSFHSEVWEGFYNVFSLRI